MKRAVLVAVSVVVFAGAGVVVSAVIVAMSAISSCTALPGTVAPGHGSFTFPITVAPGNGSVITGVSGAQSVLITAPLYSRSIAVGFPAESCGGRTVLPLVGALGGALFGGIFALGVICIRRGNKKYPYLGSPPIATG